jgi:RNA polymerase sigma factor (TIGR02999 family)
MPGKTPSSSPPEDRPHAGDSTSELLRAIEAGDREALDRLFTRVYGELKRIARSQRAGAGNAPALRTTSLVHETYLKLAHGVPWSLRDRRHFFATAARAMRLLTIDHARRRLRDKRGGGGPEIALDEDSLAAPERPQELLALDAALDSLNGSDPALAQLVEWRFYAGLTVEEIAELLDLSERTVKRHWRAARAYLHRELQVQGFPG